MKQAGGPCGSPRPSLGDSNPLKNGAGHSRHATGAAENEGRHPSSPVTETNHTIDLPDRNASGARCRLGLAGGSEGVSASDVEVVPAVNGAVELIPVRGISRVWAG